MECHNSATKRWALSLVSIETGEKRQLTEPPKGAWDFGGALAPDGHTLVFARWTSDTVSDLYALALGDNLKPEGEPRRLTFDSRPIHGIAWTPDGREIVFHSDRGGLGWLWRLDVSGHGQPQRLPFGESARNPAISSHGNRIVYSQSVSNSNIRRVNLLEPKEEAVPFIVSTRSQSAPRYSPDGSKIAFISNRSGSDQVWMCDADGSHAVQLTSLGPCGHTSWSPDGQRIVFGSDIDGYTQIFTANVHSARTQRLAQEPYTDTGPNWSHDGEWIFFASDRGGGEFQLWKTPAAGGKMVQLTKKGGWANLPSPDGKYEYYKNKHSSEGELWRVPVDGGEECKVLDSVTFMNFDVTLGGIYFISGTELRYFDFGTRTSKLIRKILKPLDRGLAVSPDEHWLIYTQIDQIGDDLMLVENFR
jgi:Tol biopolymer transport system component